MKINSCGYCGRVFDNEEKLEEHKKAIHNEVKLDINDM